MALFAMTFLRKDKAPYGWGEWLGADGEALRSCIGVAVQALLALARGVVGVLFHSDSSRRIRS